VVGVGAGKEADVFGDAPNIAVRVQANNLSDRGSQGRRSRVLFSRNGT